MFILAKILLGLAIYYYLEYRHTQKHVQQLEDWMALFRKSVNR